MGLIKLPVMLDADIGGAPVPLIPLTDGRSLAFASSVEQVIHGTSGGLNLISCKHFRGEFSVAVWFTRTASAASKRIFHISDDQTELGEVSMFLAAQTYTTRIETPGTNTAEKLYTFTNSGTGWHHIVMTVKRGASEELLLYFDGVLQSPTKTTDTSLSSRSDVNMVRINQGIVLTGNIYSTAIWNKRLNDAAVSAIYNNGNETVNLRSKKGSYKRHKYLQHWFVFEGAGFPPPNDNDMGRDYGRFTKEKINLMTNAVSITSAGDLVIDTPSGR